MNSGNSVSFLILLSLFYLALGAPKKEGKAKENHILKTETKPVDIPDIVKEVTDAPAELNIDITTQYTSDLDVDTEYENITELEATSEQTVPLVTYSSTVVVENNSEHVSKGNKTRPGAKTHHHNKNHHGKPHHKHTGKKPGLHVKKRIVHKARRPNLHHSKKPGVQGAIRDANRRREEYWADHKKWRRAHDLHLKQIAREAARKEQSQTHKARVKQVARRAQLDAREAQKKEAARKQAQLQARDALKKEAASKQAKLHAHKVLVKQAARKAHPCSRKGPGVRCENARQGQRPLVVASRGLRKVSIDSRKLVRDVQSLVEPKALFKPEHGHKNSKRLRNRGVQIAKPRSSHKFRQARQ